jgi:hypothetical protein
VERNDAHRLNSASNWNPRPADCVIERGDLPVQIHVHTCRRPHNQGAPAALVKLVSRLGSCARCILLKPAHANAARRRHFGCMKTLTVTALGFVAEIYDSTKAPFMKRPSHPAIFGPPGRIKRRATGTYQRPLLTHTPCTCSVLTRKRRSGEAPARTVPGQWMGPTLYGGYLEARHVDFGGPA